MSEKKTIQFNPDLFNFTSNKTRKKRATTSNNEIKIRTQSAAKSKLDTLKKRSILKMIRQHQEQNYQKILGKEVPAEKKKVNEENYKDNFISNFENSKQFLDNLVKENTKKQASDILNRTIKSYPTQTNSLLYDKLGENVFPTDMATSFENTVLDGNMRLTPINNPQYGCLKGGSLPTYRNWVNKTQRAQEPIVINNPVNNTITLPTNTNIITPPMNNIFIPKSDTVTMETKIDDNLRKMSEIKQTMERLQNIKNANQKKRLKQKKTVRRTYKTGKSKTVPKISVLVSNRTIRNNITTKTQLLKQVPIQEIKQFLIKRGFIKVGTIAPNDVLRKMYESAILICGEVQNHNPDNLLYNFLNQ
jgi:hypothetical protein